MKGNHIHLAGPILGVWLVVEWKWRSEGRRPCCKVVPVVLG